jgi:hypothetical protein
MTLRERNTVFKTGIGIAAVAIALIAGASALILPVRPPVFPALLNEASGGAAGVFPAFFPLAPYAAFTSFLASALYALVALIAIYYFFEKTQSPEILFFAFFVLSFSLEAVRVVIPLKKVYELPHLYLIMAERVLLFGRYFGLFSLFTASVYASGFDVQKQKNNILVLLSVVLVLSLGVPIDGFSWDNSLSMTTGYHGLFKMVEVSIALITVTSFLISAFSRGSREYVFISGASLLAFLGRDFLLYADTWFAAALGVALLAAGTWLICTKLHSVYLWL